MKPSRQDIAAPPLPRQTDWVGPGGKPRLDRLVADGPLLVHFFDFAQLNSARALPYVGEWASRYTEHGLGTIGVHTPRFEFTREASVVAAALAGLGIEWPVAVDADRAIWRSYGCEGWPSLFLWGRGGVLRWYHLGEGDYEQTELAIRGALEEAGTEAEWPALLAPLRPSDVPGAEVIVPSPELFPGGSIERPWRASADERSLGFSFEAGDAFAAATGEGELAVRVDGSPREAARVRGPGLYPLLVHDRHERHRVELEAEPGVEIYSLQFGAAPAR